MVACLHEMGTTHGSSPGSCVCREDRCWAGRSYTGARSVTLDWTHPDDVTAIYIEAVIDSTVPGTQFTPISFNGGYFGLQDSPDHVDGSQRIVFCVDNVQMMPLKRTVTFSPSTVLEGSPIPNGTMSTPRTHQTEPDSEPNSDKKGESPPDRKRAPNHFIGTPIRKTKSSPIIGDDIPCTPDTPRHFVGEANIQVLHFGSNVNVSQSSEAVHFKDDFTRWDVGQTLKFLVVHAGTARSHTCYAAYVNAGSSENQWQHLASVSVGCGKEFIEHSSHIEDCRRDGASVGQERKAQFGPVWFRRSDGTWESTKKATFEAGRLMKGQNETSVYTQSVPGTGKRVLATGGEQKDAKNTESKIGTTRKVAAPTDCVAPDVPEFPQWFFEMPHSTLPELSHCH